MDIFVTNGLWSGTDEHQDLSSLFMRERNGQILGHTDLLEPGSIMNILRFFRGDVKTGKAGAARPELAGHQRKRLFRNDGDGHFTEVGFLEGIDSDADGYTVAKADINGDGVQDLILRNADPGTDAIHYPPVQVFVNQNPSHNRNLRLQLRGTSSDRDGVGAEVTVRANGITQLQQLIANNGTVQSEKVLYFGLGRANRADEVTIKWPSGIVQKLQKIPAGSRLVTEPSQPLLSTR